jgi:hypothetical protein
MLGRSGSVALYHGRGVAVAVSCLICVGAPAATLRAQGSPGAGPDQQFLHEMADLNRGVALLAHETLHRNGAFPSKADAEKVDKQHDAEMDHVRAALTMLKDSYAGKASHADSATAAALGKEAGTGYDRTFRADVGKLDQREMATIDKFMPQLTNAQIKTLAQRMRGSAQQEAQQLGTGQ